MLAFRSEEHAQRWCDQRHIPAGESFTLDQAWRLGKEWHANRLSPEWERASAQEAEAIFSGIGLTGNFWRLT
jgi:hypothetical protein